MLNAIVLHHFRWRKKKVDGFIIPPTHFRKNDYSITEAVKTVLETPKVIPITTIEEPETLLEIKPEIEIEIPPVSIPKISFSETDEPKISSLSIASIRAKKELYESNKSIVKPIEHLPEEAFNETDVLLYWNKYAQRLGDKGHKIMESLLLINDPVLNGTVITLELPNEGSKIDFESEKQGLLGHLKGHLHNHTITIDVIVNEAVQTKQAFTAQEKYNRLSEKNPNLELLRKTFDLDL